MEISASPRQSPVWHPCSQMKDYETFKAVEIKSAEGSYLYTKNGDKIIDAISSWWCKLLGHGHPELKRALLQQMDKFEHVILANTTNDVIHTISKKLCELTKLDKVFYASDGSCAVEIALKMSLHSRIISGEFHRNRFIALENSYHGETIAALSVSDLGLYNTPYKDLLFEADFVRNIPYVTGESDPVWNDCSEQWKVVLPQLEQYAKTAAALILEPVLQGAGGMKIYSQDFLRRIAAWAKTNGIHIIADEIMTGLGRSGKLFAYEYAQIKPDFICLGKNLTAGWLPLSAVLTHNKIYDCFYDDYTKNKNFLHSHTFSGNALAASIAIKVLEILEREHIAKKSHDLGVYMYDKMRVIANKTGLLKNVRYIGALAAAELNVDTSQERAGYKIYQEAVRRGALLRPLGNTIYWLPPVTTDYVTIDKLADITEKAICRVIS